MRLSAFATRNFRLNFLDGVLFSGGAGFFSHAGVLPLFVATLTDARWPIGLVTPVLLLGLALPQLLGAAFASRHQDFWFAVRLTALLPRLWVLALVAVPFVPQPWALPVFFVVWLSYAVSLGFCMPSWLTFIAQVIPSGDRGKFFGGRTAAGAVAAVVGTGAASVVLATWPGRTGFAACFAIAAVLLFASFVSFLGTRHDWSRFHAERSSGGAFWHDAIALVRAHRSFRIYLLARVCMTAAVAATGYYAVHGVQTFHLTTAQGSLLALAIVFGPNMTAALWGTLADRYGNRWVQVPVIVAAALANLWLSLTPSLPVFVGCLFVAGMVSMINNLFDNKWMMELDEARCGTLLGVLNLALTPWLFMVPLAGGVLAELVGIPAVFVATSIALVLGALVLALLMPAPRALEAQEA
ncbi:MAG: MFS transporter [Candidatus Sericytochromatia bacterium]